VWAPLPISGDANAGTVSGVLRAFDASNVANELWKSMQDPSRDDLGNFAKYTPPTIANGKVYLATFSNQLVVYGLNPSTPNTAPTVGSVSPSSGSTAGGTAVTITGANFVTGATVTVGGLAALNVSTINGTTISASTPAHAAGLVDVIVTNPNAESGTLTNGFSFVSPTGPTVASVSPNSGPIAGGTSVTITGTNFVSGATVIFGGVAATNVTVVTSTSMTATTPAHTSGAVTVTVTNPDAQSGSLVGGFTYTSTSGTISFIQVAAAVPQSSPTSVNVPFTGTQTAGDLNIVVVGWNNSTSVVQSVQDSAGNNYSLAIGPTTGTGLRQSIYYARVNASGNNTVTVTFNQATAYPDIRILEYRGVTTLDVVAGASGSSSTTSSGSATTTSPNELIFAANTVATLTSGAGSGFTSRIITSPDGDIAEDRIVSVIGTYSATASLNSAGSWVMQMVTFK